MDLIGDLLRAGLLTQIGEGEERVAMIRAATELLARRFASDLRPMLPHALVAAVDEASTAESGPMRVADEALLTEWATCRNVFPEPPAEILRAMLASAVATAAETDHNLRAAGWYSLRSAVELLPASRWESPLSDLAKLWDDAIWQSVAEFWSPAAASSTVRMPAVPKFDHQSIGIKSPARQHAQTMAESAGFQQFAQAMQDSYVDHVETLLAASESLAAESHRKSLDALRTFSSDLGAKLRTSLAAHERSIESIRLRSDLMWWHQTAFSPSRRVGYSALDPVEVPLIAALDLHWLTPAVAPLAAEQMLCELVTRATNDQIVTIEKLAASTVDLPAGMGSAPALVLDSIQTDMVSPLLGRDQKVESGRFAVLVFRELQARRLTLGTTSDGS